jgi:hypothetical protein
VCPDSSLVSICIGQIPGAAGRLSRTVISKRDGRLTRVQAVAMVLRALGANCQTREAKRRVLEEPIGIIVFRLSFHLEGDTGPTQSQSSGRIRCHTQTRRLPARNLIQNASDKLPLTRLQHFGRTVAAQKLLFARDCAWLLSYWSCNCCERPCVETPAIRRVC